MIHPLFSTIHKAKGKEFENIFLLLNDHPLKDEEDKRMVYVAIIRAKNNLHTLHSNLFFIPE
jgi:ATP-dependent DNA helicase RecQ